MIKRPITYSVCMLLALAVYTTGYAVSLPELPDQARAGDAIGIAPGLNDTTPVGSDVIPGESLRTLPDIPSNDGGKPDPLPGNHGIADLVKGIAPGPAGTTPVSGDFIPGESIRDLVNNSADADGDVAGILSSPLQSTALALPMGGAIAIPEPSTLTIVAISIIGIIGRQRKA